MSTFNQQHNFVSVDQAAEMLAVSTKTIRNWIKSGELPAFEAGPKLIRINLLDLRAFCKPSLASTIQDRVARRSGLTAKARSARAGVQASSQVDALQLIECGDQIAND
jgi:excisionase family DNA binding protein